MIKPGGPRCPAKNHKALLMFPRIIEKILFLRSPETMCYDEAVASCGYGGIGRRAGFRSQFSQGSGGSKSFLPTNFSPEHGFRLATHPPGNPAPKNFWLRDQTQTIRHIPRAILPPD